MTRVVSVLMFSTECRLSIVSLVTLNSFMFFTKKLVNLKAFLEFSKVDLINPARENETYSELQADLRKMSRDSAENWFCFFGYRRHIKYFLNSAHTNGSDSLMMARKLPLMGAIASMY